MCACGGRVLRDGFHIDDLKKAFEEKKDQDRASDTNVDAHARHEKGGGGRELFGPYGRRSYQQSQTASSDAGSERRNSAAVEALQTRVDEVAATVTILRSTVGFFCVDVARVCVSGRLRSQRSGVLTPVVGFVRERMRAILFQRRGADGAGFILVSRIAQHTSQISAR